MGVNIFEIKRSGPRNYAHFDKRLGLLEVARFISDPDNVAKHSFYPFIFYEKKIYKYNKKNGVKEKIRPICYASHMDRCIYQYYSKILNEIYNKKTVEVGIDDCAIAYRDNKNKSNIHFAKEVFDFIKDTKKALVIVGDFKGFFDNLDHKYLKEQLYKLMNVDELSDDMYAVFKSMTKFSKCQLEDILTFKGLRNTYSGIKELNSLESIMSVEEFRSFKKNHLVKNKESYGIPQGSPLSGVFSNVYMLEFDSMMKELALYQNGLYRRYSDDFIIVVPYITLEHSKEILQKLTQIVQKIPNLVLEKDKTRIYTYSDSCIIDITSTIEPEVKEVKNILNYLGFSFDGKYVSIREKTLGKYNYRMRRKVNGIEKCGRYTKKNNRISLDKLYEKYSKKGLRKGNFISYVRNTRKIFNDEIKIANVEKNHMRNIARAIKQKKLKYSK